MAAAGSAAGARGDQRLAIVSGRAPVRVALLVSPVSFERFYGDVLPQAAMVAAKQVAGTLLDARRSGHLGAWLQGVRAAAAVGARTRGQRDAVVANVGPRGNASR